MNMDDLHAGVIKSPVLPNDVVNPYPISVRKRVNDIAAGFWHSRYVCLALWLISSGRPESRRR